jgi:hypothetical protein
LQTKKGNVSALAANGRQRAEKKLATPPGRAGIQLRYLLKVSEICSKFNAAIIRDIAGGTTELGCDIYNAISNAY